MQNDDPALRPAASPDGRSTPAAPSDDSQAQGFGPRILAWAMHGPPWTYIALAVAGLGAALLVAGAEFRG
jgi:hypothetical protein